MPGDDQRDAGAEHDADERDVADAERDVTGDGIRGAGDPPVPVGVVGVGSMGRHHARVYRELPGADLVGVADADADRAAEVAETYGAAAMATPDLLDAADAVSVAVPTRHHAGVVRAAIDRGTAVLVEKPFVADPAVGRDLVTRAREADVALQVGHVERFNPAVRALAEMVEDFEVVAADARRLGPPVDRQGGDGVVRDLMIHDLDVLLALLDAVPATATAERSGDDPYVTATLRFSDGTVCSLTASRVTQQKVRELSITARDCRVTLDYITQSVSIHRQSLPEYVEDDGGVRYRHRHVVERPTVDNGEPLRAELSAFLAAVRGTAPPPVTGEDALRALSAVRAVEAAVEADGPVAVETDDGPGAVGGDDAPDGEVADSGDPADAGTVDTGIDAPTEVDP